MLTDYSKLTDEEINHAIATKVMGWELDRFGVTYKATGSGKIESWNSDWHPTADHNDMAIVRAEIERRGLENEFVGKLIELLAFAPNVLTAWSCLDATPRQQCESALKVVEDAS